MILGITGLVAGWVIARLMLVLAHRVALIAIPNQRSFHDQPTPSGGGVALVIPVVVWAAVHLQDSPLALAVGLGGTIIALVGLVDDIRHLPSWLRLTVHLATGALAVWLLTPESLVIEPLVIAAPLLVVVMAVLAVAWLTNLYNFMDGIDGIAGVQCLIFCVGVLMVGEPAGLWAELPWLLGGAALGFLLPNWAPARIFMGDVGSGFLGFVVAVLALGLAGRGELPLVGSMILLTGFWFDATYTLCVRMATGQRFASAHRSHCYQKLAERLGHGWTSASYLAVGLAYLLPLAWLANAHREWSWPALALAVAPWLVGCVVLKAGLPSRESVA